VSSLPQILFSALILASAFSAILHGEPELSTGPGQPIEYDGEKGALVARGDATLRDGPLLLRAEEIGYYQDDQRAEAIDNVELTRRGLRVLTDKVDYDFESKTFTSEEFTAGKWPLYFEGESINAQPGSIKFNNATAYYGEPSRLSLRMKADEMTYDQDADELNIRKAKFQLGSLPLLTLPRYTGNVRSLPLRYTGRVGFSSNLGVYIQNEALLQAWDDTYAGVNLNLYSKRGVLLGPALLYGQSSGEHAPRGDLNSGYISDGNRRGTDTLGEPVDTNRYFLRWRHHQHRENTLDIHAHLNFWSDSEILRDFQNEIFNENQNPDNFLEVSQHGGPFIYSLFSRFRPNDFQFIRERLPEVRIDLPPTPLAHSGIWHRGSLQFVHLREKSLIDSSGNLIRGSFEEIESDRLDFNYAWIHPIKLNRGIRLTPRASGKVTHYFDTVDASRDSFTRVLGEFGLDLDIKSHATWDLKKPLWGINGLRHLVRHRVQYRYIPDAASGAGIIPEIDTPVLSFNRSLVNLMDERQIDLLRDRHFVRLGMENTFVTRHKKYGSRELASLNIYQDILVDRKPGQKRFDSFWTELEFNPAPWLEWALFTRFDAHNFDLSDARGRIRIHDSHFWSINLHTNFLENRFEQYDLEVDKRLNEKWKLDFRLRWDQQIDQFTEQEYGVTQKLGQYYLIRYAFRIQKEALREGENQFRLSFNFLGF